MSNMPNITSKNNDLLKFCPKCGSPATLVDLRKIVCGSAGCGFKIYVNTAAAVAALIFDEQGRLLLMRRNHPPQKGLLDLPGGFADYGETGEEALARELKEELGLTLDCENLKYCRSVPNIYEYGGVVYNTLDLFFFCVVPQAQLDAIVKNDEAEEIVFRKIADFEGAGIETLAFESMKRLISQLI